MVKLTFYGGVGEIGGNKILLEDGKTKLFLDFGMSFAQKRLYYTELLNPRTFNGLGDFLAMGLVPDLKGIYRQDLLEPAGLKYTSPQLDGVLLSHAHADHAYYVSFLDPQIPVYCGAVTKLVLEVVQETGIGDLEMEVVSCRQRIPHKHEYPEIPRLFKIFRERKRFEIGGIEVLPHSVDHSVPGAMGYVISTSAGPIVYTGDLRRRGSSLDFISKVASLHPLALLIEGTNIDEEEEGLSEEGVRERSREVTSKSDKLVIVTFSSRDTNRLKTFYEVAKESGRKLVISLKQAYLLEKLTQATFGQKVVDIQDENILIYLPKKRWGIYDEKEYKRWERPYLTYSNTVKCDYIHKNQREVLLYLDFFSLGELIDIRPDVGGQYIHSQSEPSTEEMEMDAKILHNWLERFGMVLHQIHASGHISAKGISTAIEEINPKYLIPIHTEKPERFKGLAKEVVIVKRGESYRFPP